MVFSWGRFKPDGGPGPYGKCRLAHARDSDGGWAVDPKPILPGEDGCENPSLYHEPHCKTWLPFMNRVGTAGGCTDAIWA